MRQKKAVRVTIWLPARTQAAAEQRVKTMALPENWFSIVAKAAH